MVQGGGGHREDIRVLLLLLLGMTGGADTKQLQVSRFYTFLLKLSQRMFRPGFVFLVPLNDYSTNWTNTFQTALQ